MKLSYQRGRDLFLLTVGTSLLVLEFVPPLVPGPPDTTVVIAAVGLLGSPAFLKRDERGKDE